MKTTPSRGRETLRSLRNERDALFTATEKGRRRVLELEAELLTEQREVRALSTSIAAFREGLSDVSHVVGAWARAGFDDIDSVAVASRRLLVRVHACLDGEAGQRIERVLTTVRAVVNDVAQHERALALKQDAAAVPVATTEWPPSLRDLKMAFEDFEARRSAVSGTAVYRKGT